MYRIVKWENGMNFLLKLSRLLDLTEVSTEVSNILKTWIGPLFTALGGVGTVYAIILIVQYVKAENDSKKAELKSRMINTLIGVLSLLVIGTVCLAVDWEAMVKIFGYTAEDAMIGLIR